MAEVRNFIAPHGLKTQISHTHPFLVVSTPRQKLLKKHTNQL